jgi:hypothetical protein
MWRDTRACRFSYDERSRQLALTTTMVNLLVVLIKLARLAKLHTLQSLTSIKGILTDAQSHDRCLDLSESE